MLLHSITVRLAKMIDASPALLVISVLLIAVTLFAILFGIIWVLQSFVGIFNGVQSLADEIGIEPHQLLEFIGLFVGGTILVGQLWLTHRRVSAAENTAKAAAQTADSTTRSNSAQQFKDAVESLGSPSLTIRIGGIQALGIMARDYPEYQDAVARLIAYYAQNADDDEQSRDD